MVLFQKPFSSGKSITKRQVSLLQNPFVLEGDQEAVFFP